MNYFHGAEVRIVGSTDLFSRGWVDYMTASGMGRYEADVEYGTGYPESRMVEYAGRLCYDSFAPGLNPNVKKIRTDSADYIANLIAQGHGSVLEHFTVNFLIWNVSRVLTHELVRHRTGVAISQRSDRYVRPREVIVREPELPESVTALFASGLAKIEGAYHAAESILGINDATFADKKALTSALRSFLPQGGPTALLWTANIRTIRHVIEQRTAPGAEVEIRALFQQIAAMCRDRWPVFFADYTVTDEGAWVTPHPKV